VVSVARKPGRTVHFASTTSPTAMCALLPHLDVWGVTDFPPPASPLWSAVRQQATTRRMLLFAAHTGVGGVVQALGCLIYSRGSCKLLGPRPQILAADCTAIEAWPAVGSCADDGGSRSGVSLNCARLMVSEVLEGVTLLARDMSMQDMHLARHQLDAYFSRAEVAVGGGRSRTAVGVNWDCDDGQGEHDEVDDDLDDVEVWNRGQSPVPGGSDEFGELGLGLGDSGRLASTAAAGLPALAEITGGSGRLTRVSSQRVHASVTQKEEEAQKRKEEEAVEEGLERVVVAAAVKAVASNLCALQAAVRDSLGSSPDRVVAVLREAYGVSVLPRWGIGAGTPAMQRI
jgi:hypothetical protein